MLDQTKIAWLKEIKANVLGTGIFLIPNSEKQGPGTSSKLVEPNLTYQECKERACYHEAKALKWVPQIIADFDTLMQTKCGNSCEKTCVKPGCICDQDEKICK